MASPKLRFKAFDSEWVKVDIQTLVDEKIIDKPMDGNHGEIHPTSADYVENGIPFVMATDVIDGKIHLEKSKKIRKSQADNLRKGFSIEGDILLTHKATIGNVAKVPKLETPYVMLTPQVTYYRVLNKDKLDPDFIKSTFEAPIFQNELLALCTGATRLYIGISEQRKLPFSYPAKEEQTQIASFLSAVDEKIAQLTQKHELLSQYKQGMMQKLFSQQIRFKADDGSEFGEWEELKFKDIITIKYGKDHKALSSGHIPVLGTGGVMRYVDSYLYDGESILIGRKGTIDKPQYILGKFWTVDTLFYTEIGEKILPKFAFQQLLLVNWLNLNEATGVPSLNTTSIGNIDMKVPCLAEQTKIAHFLSAIDQKIEVVAQQIEQAKQWKKGLLQQMFV